MNSWRQTHIMIVEEQTRVAMALRHVLESAFPEPCLVEVTPIAETALDTLRGGTVDLVIVDSHTPDMHGIELIYHARETSPRTHALLITTLPSLEAKRLAGQLGAGYLPRPFTLQEFLSAAHDLLSGEKERDDAPGDSHERRNRTEVIVL